MVSKAISFLKFIINSFFLSRDTIFYEHIFPYSKNQNNFPLPLPTLPHYSHYFHPYIEDHNHIPQPKTPSTLTHDNSP